MFIYCKIECNSTIQNIINMLKINSELNTNNIKEKYSNIIKRITKYISKINGIKGVKGVDIREPKLF